MMSMAWSCAVCCGGSTPTRDGQAMRWTVLDTATWKQSRTNVHNPQPTTHIATMRCSLCLLALSACSAATAFVPASIQRQQARVLAPLFAAEEAEQGGDERPKEPSISEPPTEPGTHEELMYALGVNLARQIGDVRPLVENGDELTLVAKGLLDTVIGRLDEQAQAVLLKSRQKDLNELVTERAMKIRDRLVAAGEEMLADMEKTEDVVKLDTGVLLHVVDFGPEGQGQGTRPTKASSVKVSYHGTLPDGTVFDSTLGDEPVTFAVGQVIQGWQQALLKMHEGETAMVGIPPAQGYGEQGSPDGSIPGGATLFFKIRLEEVLTAGIGGGPTLVGADGKKLKKDSESSGSGLLGADGKPL